MWGVCCFYEKDHPMVKMAILPYDGELGRISIRVKNQVADRKLLKWDHFAGFYTTFCASVDIAKSIYFRCRITKLM